jgi:hypothetical protein
MKTHLGTLRLGVASLFGILLVSMSAYAGNGVDRGGCPNCPPPEFTHLSCSLIEITYLADSSFSESQTGPASPGPAVPMNIQKRYLETQTEFISEGSPLELKFKPVKEDDVEVQYRTIFTADEDSHALSVFSEGRNTKTGELLETSLRDLKRKPNHSAESLGQFPTEFSTDTGVAHYGISCRLLP